MKGKQTNTRNIETLIERLTGLAKPPRLDNPDLQRKAEIIHTLSTLTLIAGFTTLLITPFVYQDIVQGVITTLSVILITFIVQVLNRRGHTQFAAQLFIGSIWIFDTVFILLSGGFSSLFLPALISFTIMGGLILGEMNTYYLTGSNIVVLLILFLIDNWGLTPDALLSFTPIAIIMINTVTLIQTAAVLIMVLQRYERTFKKLSTKEQDLKRTNLDLEDEIQARKEAETHLILSEKQFRSALMESPYPTMLHSEDGEILLANTALIKGTGYTLDNLPDYEGWLDHMFRENSSQVTEILDKLLAGDENEGEGVFDVYRQNGKTLNWYLRWTRLPSLSDEKTLFLTMAMDLTALTDIESTLREREELLSMFTLVTNDGLWDWDLQTDKVTYDPLYFTMAGYEVDDFPHELEEFRKRLHPDDLEEVFGQADKYLKGEIDNFNVEFRFLKKDGNWIWIMGRGKIIEQDENGNPLRFVGTHTDISAQKLVEEKLSDYQLQLEDVVAFRTQELNERIDQVERLNAALTNILDDYQAANEKLSTLGTNLSAANQELESVTYSLSTDLLSPILAIKKSADKIVKSKSQDLPEKNVAEIRKIQENADRVKDQINNLLRISQLSQQELAFVEVDPALLIKKILKSFSKEIKDNNINTIIKDLPSCSADRDLLEQVFENLISNAIKFSAEVENPEIQIGYQPDQDPDRVIYYVQDNGIGFNREAKKSVLATFEMLENPAKRSGSGIGLALAKLIINKHKGRIWAESEEGEGATFYFDLAISEVEES
jgi:PAS domain S-box-containing protein